MDGRQVRLDPGIFSRGIFAALLASEWQELLDSAPPKIYERKSLLFREGEPAEYVYVLAAGLVKTFQTPEPERDQIINILGVGDVLGVETLYGFNHPESAAALMRTTVLVLPGTLFSDLLGHRPNLARSLIRSLCEENYRVHSLVVDLGTKKALPRVASCILNFMDRQPLGRRPEPFNIPISRQEMGSYLGLSPETVSRQLKGLVTSRVIRLDHRRLTVLNLAQLRSIAGETQPHEPGPSRP